MAAAPAPTPTVVSLKQSFIAAQVNLLSQPPAPSRSWRVANDAAEAPIPSRVLDDALGSLGQTVLQHCRRVYAPQASRNVAEQISNVYSRDADRRIDAEADVDVRGRIGKELNLADDATINALPPSWPSDREAVQYPMEAKRYAEAVARLAQLSEQRKVLRLRVDRLRRLKSAVDPLHATDGTGAGIQENLMTRNGPVEKELERMRILLARVAGRVSELPGTAADDDAGDEAKVDLDALGGARKRGVDEFLADMRVFPS